MPLNVISNFAANVAHRNLAKSDMETTRSLTQLSSGQRVVSARDDAASMAIGSRLRAEVSALQAARINAGQAVSMLQVAEGAMGQVDGILVRMKSLSIQAGSSQFGSVERSLIDAEFQQLLLEIDRIVQDTEFNGANLLDGGAANQLLLGADPANDGLSSISIDSSVQQDSVFRYSYDASNEILSVTKMGVSNIIENQAKEMFDQSNISFAFDSSVATAGTFSYSFDQATDAFTITNLGTSETATLDLTSTIEQAFGAGAAAGQVPSGQSLTVDFSSLGVSVTFGDSFDFASSLTPITSVVQANVTNGNGSGVAASYGTGLSDQALSVLNGLLASGTAGQLALTTTDGGGGNGQTFDALAGVAFSVDGGAVGALNTATAAIADGNHTLGVHIDADGDGTADTQVATVTLTGMDDGQGNGSVTVDFRQRLSNTQQVQALDDQQIQLDLTDDLNNLAGTGQNLQVGQVLNLDLPQFGVEINLDKGFDRTVSLANTIGSTSDTAGTTVANGSFAPNTTFLTADVFSALLGLGFDSTTGVGYDPNTGLLRLSVSDDSAANAAGNVTIDGQAGLSFGFGDGNATGDLNGNGSTVDIAVTLADGSTVDLGTLTADFSNAGNDGGTVGRQGTVDIQLGRGIFANKIDSQALVNTFKFRIGTGEEASDEINLQIDSINTTALGLSGVDATTEENANAASVAVSNAVTVLNRARANLGALQNRLDIASTNLAVSLENSEAARSQLLDLDMAQEITNFTSKQILLQAGVSMLAQANQLPQNLLRLFQ